ncbi:Hermansky-Pudlak syndrome 4 protein isoform X2 [Varanus komodoensis]|uniref:Hermansky-Pudlak syndrome 4 protein isoform X2 n=1 Tax=Varanus komodoensis TaxID=61221 RepID=UPI001CF7AB0D|nr:Hermansky-Pudlak syndrome 4 protein isoform X2 [Varanus komodoensis]
MAASSQSDPAAGAWWSCCFLYDGSKVKEEGDPTRAGICFFSPRQTPLDQQELLCGQIAGMARCMVDVSGAPPGLIRLRKLKFAVKVDGSYLWVLGCTTDLPDVSARRLLEQLAGLFRFYNGPIHRAYMEHTQQELDRTWERCVAHLQRTPSHLHRVFASLWAVDKTKVEPLLLLKAALILQACQRVPHVLAGCILYQGLVVSTQLPPDLTARVLLQEPDAGAEDEPDGGQAGPAAGSGPLPKGVQITSVYLSEDEAAALRDVSLEWMSSPSSFHGGQGSSQAGVASAGASGLVRVALYVHRLRGLVLSLLAEERFVETGSSIEDVHLSSLASLNGLEVHLQETLPTDAPPPSKSGYGFAHYDSIQNVLTTSLPPAVAPPDQPFLRAASLLHATFARLPSVSEITVRSASAAVYACRNAVQETYFQQLGAPLRNSGVPSPHDSAFALPGKARQKLLRHGVNLL